MEKYIKDMYNNLNYKEQTEVQKILESKQHNIMNDFRNTKEINNTDYSWQNGNNILEPIADVIFKIITTAFPGFKKSN
jgi:hypothetical protein